MTQRVIEDRLNDYAHIKSHASTSVQEQAVRDLISRLLPEYTSFFHITVDPKLSGNPNMDMFEYQTNGSKLFITGTTGVACSLAVNHFLKYYCKAHVSWSGDQLNIPKPFPTVSSLVTVRVPYRFRYYQNVCTSSYSFAWMNWTRWQRQIDWMALNGINLPLAFNGQEAIWQRVFLKMGLKQEDLDSHFGGPAFLAWARMGNMKGWGGPLPSTWHKTQLELQHKILTAMRNLGMTPVFPAFAGHVPDAITTLYPKANVSKLGRWNDFDDTYCCTALLDTTDPLFKEIGESFIKEQILEYGTNHIYNADTFNEMTPKSSDPSYLSAASKGVYEGMTAGDPQAIWLMQGWLFQFDSKFWKAPQIKGLLDGIPIGKMIILDLFAEINPIWQNISALYGQPFIWCMLHNFGGNQGLYGAIESVATNPVKASHNSHNTMLGTGLTPEGIFQNDMMYDLMNEMGWRSVGFTPTELQDWVISYAERRYGGINEQIAEAWKLLIRSVYNCSDVCEHHCNSVIVMKPSFNIAPHIWFNPEDVYAALYNLLSVADEFSNVETFRYDLVDVTREALHLIATKVYNRIINAYKTKQASELIHNGSKLIELLGDLDTLLLTNEHFLLGRWLNAAKDLATTPDEVRLHEYNARNQVTLWGPTGEIEDYANKMWNGLVGSYYRPRWILFIEELYEAVSQGKTIDYDAFSKQLLVQETLWTYGSESYPDKPVGDSVAVAKNIYQKYAEFIDM
ncbi:alpha-N-acetylglucosaminidase-like [Actinia tenebrosa]|uniref:Alpha-N-acetylglucosaminidase n=1 Tax=Actinia tenebrosa TaxID=6105 RepID=A0A6P8IT62_ACTTE|nr:alpha-N-acetylglucosaminidase-like [Actinia tenebrosa]